jgi:predicted nuclease of predicted toxin-antitoxin system
VKFLVDAQLPKRISGWFLSAGHDARHTLDLAEGNRTPDEEVVEIADQEGRILLTKDADFVDAHLLQGRPKKLLLISTGNISNRDLEALIVPLIPDLVHEFETQMFLELGPNGLIVRG